MPYSFPPPTAQSSNRTAEHLSTVGYSLETQESWVNFIHGAGAQDSSLLDPFSVAPPAHSNPEYFTGETNDRWALWTPPESPNRE